MLSTLESYSLSLFLSPRDKSLRKKSIRCDAMARKALELIWFIYQTNNILIAVKRFELSEWSEKSGGGGRAVAIN